MKVPSGPLTCGRREALAVTRCSGCSTARCDAACDIRIRVVVLIPFIREVLRRRVAHALARDAAEAMWDTSQPRLASLKFLLCSSLLGHRNFSLVMSLGGPPVPPSVRL